MTETMMRDATHAPVLTIAAGRQRAGKTAYLNVLGQYTRERGARVVLWNSDQQNVTNNLNTFHSDALQPPSGEVGDIKQWLEDQLGHIAEHQYDAVLDVGGGETAFSKILREVDVSGMLRSYGVRVVLASLMAPDPADVDYLAAFLAKGHLRPEDVLIILNAGLVDSETSFLNSFLPVTGHPVVKHAMANGSPLAVMPVLGCMAAVTERGLTFQDALSGRRREDGTALSIVDRQRVATWWRKSIPAFMKDIPASMLPAMTSDTPIVDPQAAK